MKHVLGGRFASLKFPRGFNLNEQEIVYPELTDDSSEEPELAELHSEAQTSIKILSSSGSGSVDIMLENGRLQELNMPQTSWSSYVTGRHYFSGTRMALQPY
jgi:hypothetical protein